VPGVASVQARAPARREGYLTAQPVLMLSSVSEPCVVHQNAVAVSVDLSRHCVASFAVSHC